MSFLFNGDMKLILFSLISALVSFQANAVTSEVVAKIGKDIITSRKVFADVILEANWTKSSNVKKVPLQSDEFNNDLNRYLMERVVYLESRSFSLISVTESEIQKNKKSILQRIKGSGSQAFWSDLGMTDEEVVDLVKQKIASQKFIEFKSKASYVPVTEAEAFNYYQNNKSKFEGKEYKNIKENIKRSLAKTQAEQRLEDWYDILKKKYDVTKIISYTPE